MQDEQIEPEKKNVEARHKKILSAIRRARKKAGYTQEEAAKWLDIHRNTFSQKEQGEEGCFTLPELLILDAHLNLDMLPFIFSPRVERQLINIAELLKDDGVSVTSDF